MATPPGRWTTVRMGWGFLFTREWEDVSEGASLERSQIDRQDCKGKGGGSLVVWSSGSLNWQLTSDIGSHDWQLPYVIPELFNDANHKQTRHCLQPDPLQTMYLENPQPLELVEARTMRSDVHEEYPKAQTQGRKTTGSIISCFFSVCMNKLVIVFVKYEISLQVQWVCSLFSIFVCFLLCFEDSLFLSWFVWWWLCGPPVIFDRSFLCLCTISVFTLIVLIIVSLTTTSVAAVIVSADGSNSMICSKQADDLSLFFRQHSQECFKRKD